MSGFYETTNESSSKQLLLHLDKCNYEFSPPLSERVNLKEYSDKMCANALRFEIWEETSLIALLAIYINTASKTGFITNVSLVPEYFGTGLGNKLLERCLGDVIVKQLNELELEVNKVNTRALKFYRKNGFVIKKEEINSYYLSKQME